MDGCICLERSYDHQQMQPSYLYRHPDKAVGKRVFGQSEHAPLLLPCLFAAPILHALVFAHNPKQMAPHTVPLTSPNNFNSTSKLYLLPSIVFLLTRKKPEERRPFMASSIRVSSGSVELNSSTALQAAVENAINAGERSQSDRSTLRVLR